MPKKVSITGAKGIVGTIVCAELSEYEINQIDLPKVDVSNFDETLKAVVGSEIIMHFAWDSEIESAYTSSISPNNIIMANNIFNAALRAGIKRVVIASSIHADNYNIRRNGEILSPYRLPIPKSLYGSTKDYIEAMGRFYASTKKLEVICLRFGIITPNDRPPQHDQGPNRFLRHSDLGRLLYHCIEAKVIPNNYCIIYAISGSPEKIFDLKNPIGWIPKDSNKKDLAMNTCPCPKEECPRFNKCAECEEFNKKVDKIPYCLRTHSKAVNNMPNPTQKPIR